MEAIGKNLIISDQCALKNVVNSAGLVGSPMFPDQGRHVVSLKEKGNRYCFRCIFLLTWNLALSGLVRSIFSLLSLPTGDKLANYGCIDFNAVLTSLIV
jgi:hypothetical protein